jgi:hypothetical protein
MDRRRQWFGATFVVASLGLSGIPAGAQQQIPSVTVPSVTVPQVSVPSVTTPTVTVPPVKTSTVTAPPVKTPTVTAPPVKTPTVTAPPVKTPTVTAPSVKTPAVTTPPVKTPAGTVPSTSTPSASVPSVSTGSSSSSGLTGSGSSSAGSSAGGGGSSSSASPSGATSPSGIAPRATGTTPADATAIRVALRNTTSAETPKGDRALRDAVLRFEGCLDSVPRTQRRVLELRAGVGSATTRSRAEVARLTGLRTRSVARLERRGLKRLRTLANRGTCAGATRGTVGGAAPVAPGGASAQPVNAGDAPRVGVLAAHTTPHSAESKTSGGNKSAIQAAIERPIIHAMGHSLDLGPLLLAFALGGLLYVVARELRRAA